MPFRYAGSKKATARYYPPPAYRTIVEPFAGAAGYSLHWWRPGTRVVLIEKDPTITGLWRRLQAITPAQLLALRCPEVGERPADIVVAAAIGSLVYTSGDRPVQPVTRPSKREFELYLARFAAALPLIREWTVIEGDYHDAPDVKATWFIDPPYQHALESYRDGSRSLDYPHLAEWCRARKGQVIVCERADAAWLPFKPLRSVRTMAATSRSEGIWHRSPASTSASNRHARAAKLEAAKRRSARRSKVTRLT